MACRRGCCAVRRPAPASPTKLGVEIRVGTHTGECELIGEDVGGIAVHIASRVSALAGPGEVRAASGTIRRCRRTRLELKPFL